MDVTTPEKPDISRPPAPGEIFPASKSKIASYDSSIKPSAASAGLTGTIAEPKSEPISSYAKNPAPTVQPTNLSGSDNGVVTTGSSVSSAEPPNHHRLAIIAVALLVLLLCGGLLFLIIHNAKQQQSRLKAAEQRLERSIKANSKKGSGLKVTNLQSNGNINIGGNYQVNGSQITSGNLADASNIAFLNRNQTFTGANAFVNSGNAFNGNGAGLKNVPAVTLNGQPGSFYQNASNLTSGTLSNSRLPSNLSVAGTISFGTLGVADTATTLCRNSANQLATCTGGGPSSSFLQGGNSFGTTAVLGTNDSNSLTFETNNTTQATIAVGGATTFKNSTDSTAAFQIQNANGDSLLNTDSVNSIVTIGFDAAATGSWQTNANSLPAARQNAVTTNYNGYAYVIGGANDGSDSGNCGTATNTVYYAALNGDGTTGSWSTTAAIPSERCGAMGVTADGYIYVIGGSDSGGNTTDTVYYAQPNGDGTITSWTTNAQPLPSVKDSGSVVADNGYIYVVDGESGWNGSGNSDIYWTSLNGDGSTNAWNSDTLPRDMLWGTAQINNGYIYMIGGYSEASEVDYAPLDSGTGAIGSWNTTTNLLRNLYSMTSVVSNGYLYVLGGSNPSYLDTAVDTVYYAPINNDGTLGTWGISANAMPTAQEFAGSFINNGYVYEIGGEDNGSGGTVRSTVYYASLPASINESNGLSVKGNSTFQGILSVLNSDGTTGLEIRAGGSGLQNTFIGVGAGQANTTGSSNTALGYQALQSNTTGSSNIALGYQALQSNTTGNNNIALGIQTLYNNTTGSRNIALGGGSLISNAIGSDNIAVGETTLANNTTGQYNVALGHQALYFNTTGNFNVALGYQASVTSGALNNATAIGAHAMVNQSDSLVLGCASPLNSCTVNTKVGIDNASPAHTLDVAGDALFQTLSDSTTAFQVQDSSANPVLLVSTNNYAGGYNAADATLKVAKDSVTSRSINAAGSVNASGADYAEYIPWSGALPEPGTVVQYNGSSYVVSSRLTAAFVGNDKFESTGSILVTFAGQVPVKVSGTANAGDILVDNHDGTAKAINPATASIAQLFGKIGIAEESGSGSVLAAIGTTSADITGANALQQGGDASFASLNVSGNTTLTDLTVTGAATVGSLSVTGSAEFAGNITVNGNIILGPNSKLLGNDNTRGQITISAGQTQKAYAFPSAYSEAPNVVITPTSDPGSSYWVSDITKNGFIVHVGSAPPGDLKFNFQAEQ